MDPLAVCVYGADESPAPSRYDTIRYAVRGDSHWTAVSVTYPPNSTLVSPYNTHSTLYTACHFWEDSYLASAQVIVVEVIAIIFKDKS